MPEEVHSVTFRRKDAPDQPPLERIFTSRRAMETFLKTAPSEIEVITWSGHDRRPPRPTTLHP